MTSRFALVLAVTLALVVVPAADSFALHDNPSGWPGYIEEPPHDSNEPADRSYGGYLEQYLHWCSYTTLRTVDNPFYVDECSQYTTAWADNLAEDEVSDAEAFRTYAETLAELPPDTVIEGAVGSVVGLVEETTGTNVSSSVDAGMGAAPEVSPGASTGPLPDPDDVVHCLVDVAPGECLPAGGVSQNDPATNGATVRGMRLADWVDLDVAHKAEGWWTFTLYYERASARNARPAHTRHVTFWGVSMDGSVKRRTRGVRFGEGWVETASSATVLADAEPKEIRDYGSSSALDITLNIWNVGLTRTWNRPSERTGGVASRADGYHVNFWACRCFHGQTGPKGLDSISLWRHPSSQAIRFNVRGVAGTAP